MPRRIRSDKGKKRKFYAGKSVKRRKLKGNFSPYVSKRGRNDPIKIMFFQVVRMSKDGYNRWSKQLKPYVNKTVFKAIGSSLIVDPKDISTPERIGEVAIDYLQAEGNFQLRLFVHRKNKHHVSPCKRADVIIQNTENGLRVKVINTQKLSRYWFWRGS